MSAPPAPSRWLFGPVPDLLLGCGLGYVLIWGLLSIAGPEIRAVQPTYLLTLMILLTVMPHYGGTLLRVYEQRNDRRAYTIFAVWATLAVGVLFVVGVHDAFIGSLMFTVYLTWSPWHYTGQNYGIAVMFLRRRGVSLTPLVKRWLYASFLLSFVLTFLVMHLAPTAGYDPLAYEGNEVSLLPLGIPESLGDLLVPVVGIAYLVATLVAAVLLLRSGSVRAVLPAGALALTQALWFSAPFSARYFGWTTGFAPVDEAFSTRDYVMWTFVGHGVQYLWVTTYYARTSGHWGGYANYLGKAAASGIALWTLPFIFFSPDRLGGLANDAGLALVVAAAVNLHHFILDGAIWKLRHTKIAGVLIRSQEEQPDAAQPERGRLRPWIWGTATLALMIGCWEFYQTNVVLPRELRQKDWTAAETTLDRLAWFGYDRAKRRYALARMHDQAGDLDAAAAQYTRSLELKPMAEGYALLGWAEERRGNDGAAEAAYRSALTDELPRPDMIHAGLARVAHGRGEYAAAIEEYREALRLRPTSANHANDLAWLLAACPDPGLRSPEESIQLSLATLEAIGRRDPNVLDTLAVGYAAAGRYDDAVAAADEALVEASSSGNEDLRRDIEQRLDLYRGRRAYVEERPTRGV